MVEITACFQAGPDIEDPGRVQVKNSIFEFTVFKTDLTFSFGILALYSLSYSIYNLYLVFCCKKS